MKRFTDVPELLEKEQLAHEMHEHGVLAAAACEGLRGVPAPPPAQRLLILLVAAAPVALCVGCYSAIGEGPATYRTLRYWLLVLSFSFFYMYLLATTTHSSTRFRS